MKAIINIPNTRLEFKNGGVRPKDYNITWGGSDYVIYGWPLKVFLIYAHIGLKAKSPLKPSWNLVKTNQRNIRQWLQNVSYLLMLFSWIQFVMFQMHPPLKMFQPLNIDRPLNAKLKAVCRSAQKGKVMIQINIPIHLYNKIIYTNIFLPNCWWIFINCEVFVLAILCAAQGSDRHNGGMIEKGSQESSLKTNVCINTFLSFDVLLYFEPWFNQLCYGEPFGRCLPFWLKIYLQT